jgi:uncharacterized small protein (DUF1192 family)
MLTGAVVAYVGLGGATALAWPACTQLAPGADGVLRLDTAGTPARPCAAPRLDEGMPPGLLDAGVAPAPPRLRRPHGPRHAATDRPAAQLAPSTSQTVPAAGDAMPAAPPNDTQRLEQATARLQGEIARLRAEIDRLQAQTVGLKQQLAQRDAAIAVASPGSGAGGGSGGVAPPNTPLATAHDMTATPAPAGADHPPPPPSEAETLRAAQAEFDRQASVMERAWTQLRALADRMKKRLGGSGQ